MDSAPVFMAVVASLGEGRIWQAPPQGTAVSPVTGNTVRVESGDRILFPSQSSSASSGCVPTIQCPHQWNEGDTLPRRLVVA